MRVDLTLKKTILKTKNNHIEKGDLELFKYRIDILRELRNSGYNTTRLRDEKLLSQASIQDIRNGKIIGIHNLDKICTLLKCQPGDVIEHIS